MSRHTFQRHCVLSWSPILHWTTSEPLPADLVQTITADNPPGYAASSPGDYHFHYKHRGALQAYVDAHGFEEGGTDDDVRTWQPLSNFDVQVVSDGKAWQTDKYGCTAYRDQIRFVFTPKTQTPEAPSKSQ